ncbi:MAG: ABC transporter substrate-binding protein [Planctomycetota bacterium]|jgi:iron complex transport system substrate-binding protein
MKKLPPKKWTFVIIAVAALIICLAICSYESRNKVYNAGSGPSGSGPKRIASLAPNLTEILFALGLDEKIVAVSNDSDYPPEAAGKKRTGTFWQPEAEAIIACRPELVITLGFEQQRAVAGTLRRLGYNVLTLNIEKIEDLFEAIDKIGGAAGCRQQANELNKRIAAQVDNLKSKYGSSARRVRVLWVVQPEPLRVAGRNTFINELLELAGGENAIGETIQQYPSIDSEELFACAAEVIIQSAMSTSQISEQQKAAEAYWQNRPNLPAVKTNRIYVLNPDTLLRLGPRLPEGIQLIAECLHRQTAEGKGPRRAADK